MEHQTLRINDPSAIGSIHLEEEVLKKYYFNGLSTAATTREPKLSGGVRLAPLAEFDKDFDIPYQTRHKVKLFKALYIFFSGVLMVF